MNKEIWEKLKKKIQLRAGSMNMREVWIISPSTVLNWMAELEKEAKDNDPREDVTHYEMGKIYCGRPFTEKQEARIRDICDERISKATIETILSPCGVGFHQHISQCIIPSDE